MKEGVAKMSKEMNESLIKGNPPLEYVYQPVAGIMHSVKSGKSAYFTEIKSVKNVLKMIAGLLQAKITAMEKS